jgi:phage/plasmid-like protein (TIGR03299 family)
MAHELTQRKNGFVEMAYFGELPWHGLGQVIEADDSLEVIQRKAGMDWQIESAPVEYFAVPADGDDVGLHQFEGHKVLYRGDNANALSVVSSKFKVVQPSEIIEFFRDLCDANDFRLTSAGTLYGGKQFWAQADIGEEAYVTGNDLLKGKLLLVTSCDGSLATTGKFCNERTICMNTLTNALRETGSQIRVTHRETFDPKLAKQQLGVATDSFGAFLVQARKLANKTVTYRTAENFVRTLLTTDENQDVTKTAGYQAVMDLFENGKGNTGETAWDLVNGVSEYVDHVVKSRSESNRMYSAYFGRGDKLKSIAFNMACALT